MIKEIGSIFPLYSEFINQKRTTFQSEDKKLYSLCRETFTVIANSLCSTNKTVLIPAYTCQTVITPFEEAGWTCLFFNIHKNLRIDIDHLNRQIESHHPILLIVHPYFGMDLDEDEAKTIQYIRKRGVKVVIDLTQCIFSEQKYPYADYIVGSYRKWFAIPDGGFLTVNSYNGICQPTEENEPFVTRQVDAMYLRGLYFQNGDYKIKQISIRLSKAADQVAEKDIAPHRMSTLSCQLLEQEDRQANQLRRTNNFTCLFDNIRKSEKYEFVCKEKKTVTTAPLYFTIYVQDRQALQRQLAQDYIYAPVIWPVEDERVLINDEVKYIYDHLLAIPCDQRYDENDMKRVVDIINQF